MNTLSWILYFADIVENITPLCGSMIFVIIVVLAISWVGRGVVAVDLLDREFPTLDYPNGSVEYRKHQFFKKITEKKIVYFSLFLLSLIILLVPSKQTVYMIAASQAGEQIVKSQEAKDILDSLKKVIESYVKEEKHQ